MMIGQRGVVFQRGLYGIVITQGSAPVSISAALEDIIFLGELGSQRPVLAVDIAVALLGAKDGGAQALDKL